MVIQSQTYFAPQFGGWGMEHCRFRQQEMAEYAILGPPGGRPSLRGTRFKNRLPPRIMSLLQCVRSLFRVTRFPDPNAGN